MRGVVTDEVVKQLLTSLVFSRLDYRNSALLRRLSYFSSSHYIRLLSQGTN